MAIIKIREKPPMFVANILSKAYNDKNTNSSKSKVYKKWVMFLKQNKLYDEFMVYMTLKDYIGANPITYRNLSVLCRNLDKLNTYKLGKFSSIYVKWYSVFLKFADKNIKWYHFKEWFQYHKSNKYLK